MSENALTIKPISEDGHHWPSNMIQAADNGFDDCSLDHTAPVAEAAG